MFRNLNAELCRCNIKTKELAHMLGVSIKTINNKMSGRSEFTLSEIKAIASLFPNVSITYLFETTAA